MRPEQITVEAAVTLVGAGRVSDAALEAARRIGTRLFAADGGALRLQARGLRPEAIIGDLDSLGPKEPWEAAGIPVHEIGEQETTDFEKCLRTIEAPILLAVGFAGDRLDHLLATLSALAARPDKRVIVLGDDDICFLAPSELRLDLRAGTRLSLWPVAEARVTRCEGLVWPAKGLLLSPTGRIGTSNAALGGPVRLGFDRRHVFVLLPMSELAQAAARLSR